MEYIIRKDGELVLFKGVHADVLVRVGDCCIRRPDSLLEIIIKYHPILMNKLTPFSFFNQYNIEKGSNQYQIVLLLLK